MCEFSLSCVKRKQSEIFTERPYSKSISACTKKVYTSKCTQTQHTHCSVQPEFEGEICLPANAFLRKCFDKKKIFRQPKIRGYWH